MPEKKNSAAKIRANNRYNEKAYDRINIAVTKGKKEVYQEHAQRQGESLNAFANRALDETMQHDNEKAAREDGGTATKEEE